jgi:hypothetical protein
MQIAVFCHNSKIARERNAMQHSTKTRAESFGDQLRQGKSRMGDVTDYIAMTVVGFELTGMDVNV